MREGRRIKRKDAKAQRRKEEKLSFSQRQFASIPHFSPASCLPVLPLCVFAPLRLCVDFPLSVMRWCLA